MPPSAKNQLFVAAITLLKRKPKWVIDRIKRIDRACDEKAHMSRKHNDTKKDGLSYSSTTALTMD